MISTPANEVELTNIMQTSLKKQASDGKCPFCQKGFLIGQKLSGRDWFLSHYDCVTKNS